VQDAHGLVMTPPPDAAVAAQEFLQFGTPHVGEGVAQGGQAGGGPKRVEDLDDGVPPSDRGALHRPALARASIKSPHDAGLHNALGVIEQPGNAAVAAGHFGRAADSDPQNVLAGLNLAEALALCGKREAAVEQARRTVACSRRDFCRGTRVFSGQKVSAVYAAGRSGFERALFARARTPAGSSGR
jgi:hypothetical protein